jgi:hypothetical protein
LLTAGRSGDLPFFVSDAALARGSFAGARSARNVSGRAEFPAALLDGGRIFRISSAQTISL